MNRDGIDGMTIHHGVDLPFENYEGCVWCFDAAASTIRSCTAVPPSSKALAKRTKKGKCTYTEPYNTIKMGFAGTRNYSVSAFPACDKRISAIHLL